MRQSLAAYALAEGMAYMVYGAVNADCTEEQRIAAYREWKCKVATYAAADGCDLVDERGNRLSTREACDLINVGIVVEVVS